jgi:nitrite reductase/ring-hydroxylating ferredoxin subunit
VNIAPGESNGGEGVAWYRVLAPSDLPEGRVTAVAAGPHSVAITHFQGQFAALANRCPHQGGPLLDRYEFRLSLRGREWSPTTS